MGIRAISQRSISNRARVNSLLCGNTPALPNNNIPTPSSTPSSSASARYLPNLRRRNLEPVIDINRRAKDGNFGLALNPLKPDVQVPQEVIGVLKEPKAKSELLQEMLQEAKDKGDQSKILVTKLYINGYAAIKSCVLGEVVIFIRDEKSIEKIPSQFGKCVIYTWDELVELRRWKVGADDLKLAHDIKREFGGRIEITSSNRNQKETEKRRIS